MTDTRNVTDEFKGVEHNKIVKALDGRGVELEIAIENLERDYNMGTIVRTANAFGVRTIHIIGRRQWNKRGAMATDKYLRVEYHADVEAFFSKTQGKTRIAVDNLPSAVDLRAASLPLNSILIFGSESAGLSGKMLAACTSTVQIPQLGSTRSINVGVAAGILMYEWLRRNVL